MKWRLVSGIGAMLAFGAGVAVVQCYIENKWPHFWHYMMTSTEYEITHAAYGPVIGREQGAA